MGAGTGMELPYVTCLDVIEGSRYYFVCNILMQR